MYCPRYFKYDDRTTQIFEDGLKEGVKTSFFKNNRRLSAREDGKSLNRKTESRLSLSKYRSCPFRIKIIYALDGYYYIKPITFAAKTFDECCQHKNHIFVSDEKRKHFISQMKQTDLDLINACDQSGFMTQMTSQLLLNKTKNKWLSSQISYILSRKSLNIIENNIQDSKLSSASKLINYLSSQKDITFVI